MARRDEQRGDRRAIPERHRDHMHRRQRGGPVGTAQQAPGRETKPRTLAVIGSRGGGVRLGTAASSACAATSMPDVQ
mgnify:CR=1 FL=1